AIELNTDKIDQDKLKESEILANEVVASNLPIDILFIGSDEYDKYPFRKPLQREGTIRVIKIGEFEYSACGGTHCNCTAEVGLIKITDMEMMRNHVLVKFLAGSLAVDDYMKRYDVTYKLSTDMTCHYSDLIGRFEKLTEENKEQKLKIAQLNRELIPVLVEKIITKAEKINGVSLVFESIDETDKKLLNNLTSQIAENITGIAVIYSDSKLIIGADKTSKLSAGELAKKINTAFDLKGGGNAVLAQIGGVDSQKAELVRKFIIKTLSDEL
ncbi:MAG: DHHA1 domain-containing protein, partial [bacterium]